MAKKKNKNTQVANTAKKDSLFDAGLLSMIGCGIVMLFVLVLMAGIGVAIVYVANGMQLTDFDFANPVIIVAAVAAIFCVLIGLAWAEIKFIKWETKHTVINGSQLKFNGTAFQLLGNCFKWLFLTIITVGIYGLWLPIKVRKWRAKHTTSKVIEDDYSYQPQITFNTY